MATPTPARNAPQTREPPAPRKERRKTLYNPAGNPLLWCKWVGYLFLCMAGYFAQSAKPPEIGFFHHLLESTAARHWNRDLLTLSWIFLWLTILVNMGGLALNTMRLRRKNDHISVSLIVLLLLTVVAMGVVPAGNPIWVLLSHL
ncbi:MAG: hypothetical protein HQL96_00635 [Magnetococcales bacterium]|nr:hypothetical protein [Magnetococcales bacterium]